VGKKFVAQLVLNVPTRVEDEKAGKGSRHPLYQRDTNDGEHQERERMEGDPLFDPLYRPLEQVGGGHR
jgi:hypothetical protein